MISAKKTAKTLAKLRGNRDPFNNNFFQNLKFVIMTLKKKKGKT